VPIKQEHKLPDIITNLAKECIEMLLDHAGQPRHHISEKTEIPWNLFKNLNAVCKKKIDYSGEYLEHLLNMQSLPNNKKK
jgi:adenylate cyclase